MSTWITVDRSSASVEFSIEGDLEEIATLIESATREGTLLKVSDGRSTWMLNPAYVIAVGDRYLPPLSGTSKYVVTRRQ
jgi:hypothetical protein